MSSPSLRDYSTLGGNFPSVVVTSMVATTSLGEDLDSTWKNLLAGESGIRELTDDFITKYNLPVRIGGRLVQDPATEVSRVEARRMAYVERIAHVMSKRLWAQAGEPEVDKDRLAVVIGTGQGGAEEGEPDVLVRRGQPENPDAGGHRDGGTGRDTEQTGVAQRVAGQFLGQRAGHAEGDPDQQPEQGTRKAQFGHEQRVAAAVAGQRPQRLARRYVFGTHQHAGQAGEDDRGQQRQEDTGASDGRARARPGPGLVGRRGRRAG